MYYVQSLSREQLYVNTLRLSWIPDGNSRYQAYYNAPIKSQLLNIIYLRYFVIIVKILNLINCKYVRFIAKN